MQGSAERLPTPQPFRNLIAEARHGASKQEHEEYFRRLAKVRITRSAGLLEGLWHFMACQLQLQNQDIGLLAVLDAYPASPSEQAIILDSESLRKQVLETVTKLLESDSEMTNPLEMAIVGRTIAKHLHEMDVPESMMLEWESALVVNKKLSSFLFRRNYGSSFCWIAIFQCGKLGTYCFACKSVCQHAARVWYYTKSPAGKRSCREEM
jgi:hypothetical protein